MRTGEILDVGPSNTGLDIHHNGRGRPILECRPQYASMRTGEFAVHTEITFHCAFIQCSTLPVQLGEYCKFCSNYGNRHSKFIDVLDVQSQCN